MVKTLPDNFSTEIASQKKGMTISRIVGRYVVDFISRDLPEAAIDEAKRCLVDWAGVTLAGSRDREVAAATELRLLDGREDNATLLGRGERSSAAIAAFVNGVAGHVLNYDDMSPTYIGHNSALLMPVALGVGEYVGATGVDVLKAFVTGWEVSCALGWGTIPRHYQLGWHASGTIGAIGATATAANLFNLSVDQTAHALGIAASSAAGLRVNFGTSANVFHIGRAAEYGVISAALARKGWTSAPDSLEGFYEVLAQGHDPSEGLSRLSRMWSILEPGVSRKSYPTCGAMHPAFDAIVCLVREGIVTPENVDSIECRTTPAVAALLSCANPTTPMQARYCLPFGVAIAILHGRVGLDEFTDEMLVNPSVRDLMAKISIHVDPNIAGADLSSDFTTEVAVTLRDGRMFERRVLAPKGPMTRNMSDEDIEAKFRTCVRWAGLNYDVEALLGSLCAFDEIGNVRDIRSWL